MELRVDAPDVVFPALVAASTSTWHIGSDRLLARTAPNWPRCSASSISTRSISTSNTFCRHPTYVLPTSSNE